MKPVRVYLTGAHSTGKTTLARWIANTYELPLITEVARGILAEQEITLPQLRVDVKAACRFQGEVLQRQIELEAKTGKSFVSDRAFDNLAYACNHTLALRDLVETAREYSDGLITDDCVVFFIRPHRDLLRDDGVRAIGSWEEVQRIDGMVKMLLELADIDYVSIDTANMAERVRTVRAVMRFFA